MLLLNRALSDSEVAQVARWSWETHGVGLDLMNFSPDAWTGVSAGQVYWTPPAHMQPLSSRTLRFFIHISSTNSIWRSVVRFGPSTADDVRRPAIWIIPEQRSLQFCANGWPGVSVDCPTELVGPSFVTVVWTRTSVSAFFNTIKQTHASCSSAWSQNIQDTDVSTIALRTQQPTCLLYTSPSPRDVEESRMPSSA